MDAIKTALKPRKSPVQARSAATIEALHIAAIQVLTRDGLVRCTTTRIAHRAGVSVGSFYQYYPNRDALLAAVLEKHLDRIARAVEQACHNHAGMPVKQMAGAFAHAFVSAKFRNAPESRALYAVAEARGGTALANRMRTRIVAATAAMLASAPDARFEEPAMIASIALGALVGPVQTFLKTDVPPGAAAGLMRELIILVTAYFRTHQVRRKTRGKR